MRRPAWSFHLLRLAAPRGPERDAIIGDFEEEFADLARARGQRAGSTWYSTQVLLSLAPLVGWRLQRCVDRRLAKALSVGWLVMVCGFVLVAMIAPTVLDVLGAKGASRLVLFYFMVTLAPMAAGAVSAGLARSDDPLAAHLLAVPCALTMVVTMLLSPEHEGLLAWALWLSIVPAGVIVGARWKTAS